MPDPAQSMSVKRAQVDFHNFASFGEPERVLAAYADENFRRGSVLKKNRDFICSLTPFAEVGANAGHTSYMLANEFHADGFALDLSADALRHGRFLRTAWDLKRSPVLTAGDATHLPFQDNSLAFVVSFQTLSQFLDVESVVREVHRVLAPGGVYYFAEEPVRRRLTLGRYRVPYPERMTPREKWLYDSGLLDFLASDVIGADQEESFGIRQNHAFGLRDWADLLNKYFETCRLITFPRERGWANQIAQTVIRWLPGRPEERVADLLGATLAAFCRKAGTLPARLPLNQALACPDCQKPLNYKTPDELVCDACGFAAQQQDDVFNLLSTALRAELYPGNRLDTLDFSKPGHEAGLLSGFYEVEGDFGSKYRWIGGRAVVRLVRMRPGAPLLRVQGFAPSVAKIELRVNGRPAGQWNLDRPGLFVVQSPLPEEDEYEVEILASPTFDEPHQPAGEGRVLSLNLSLIKLLPQE
ncbi:methyltransferase domain-containing protein [uncultured Paludibaculum sp.]|uniref:methyltransferase domain-containing protein n=1 Tax=uncultured Paludibaculum sp. TaxID=1765020 RepID=UPI002AAA78DC|nr:methyltransferase domain-containing protein [uncultured Paludibaculum sp.]